MTRNERGTYKRERQKCMIRAHAHPWTGDDSDVIEKSRISSECHSMGHAFTSHIYYDHIVGRRAHQQWSLEDKMEKVQVHRRKEAHGRDNEDMDWHVNGIIAFSKRQVTHHIMMAMRSGACRPTRRDKTWQDQIRSDLKTVESMHDMTWHDKCTQHTGDKSQESGVRSLDLDCIA